jgi:hypothetical protein
VTTHTARADGVDEEMLLAEALGAWCRLAERRYGLAWRYDVGKDSAWQGAYMIGYFADRPLERPLDAR